MSSISAPDSDQATYTDPLDVIVDALQQRELLAPGLLLSAGYTGLPFFVQQLFLLLLPLRALLGLSLRRQEAQHVVRQ